MSTDLTIFAFVFLAVFVSLTILSWRALDTARDYEARRREALRRSKGGRSYSWSGREFN